MNGCETWATVKILAVSLNNLPRERPQYCKQVSERSRRNVTFFFFFFFFNRSKFQSWNVLFLTRNIDLSDDLANLKGEEKKKKKKKEKTRKKKTKPIIPMQLRVIWEMDVKR